MHLPSKPSQQPRSFWQKLVRFLTELRRLDVAFMLAAGAIHHTAGFTWGYNQVLYFDQHLGPEWKGRTRNYLMLCQAIAGVSGALIGGTLTDFLTKRLSGIKLSDIRGALIILISSAVLASPFYALALYLNAPQCFIVLLFGICASEMWFGVFIMAIAKLFDTTLRGQAIGYTYFILRE